MRLATRTGINSGEVVAGDPAGGQALVTGDAVNVAARLEQAAAPGRDPDRRARPGSSSRTPSSCEPVEPLEVKGQERAGSPPGG